MKTVEESLRSFCNPVDVDACFVMVDASVADFVPSAALRCIVHVFTSTPDQARDVGAAMNALAAHAVAAGFTHALTCTSNEMLASRSDGQMCTALPVGWQHADVVQLASDCKNRPTVDALVRLSAVEFAGVFFSAPIPRVPPTSLIVTPWNDVCVVTTPRLVTVRDVQYGLDRMWEQLSDMNATRCDAVDDSVLHAYVMFQLTLVSCMLPECADDAESLLDARVIEGASGWAGLDGLYFASRALAQRDVDVTVKGALLHYVTIAEMGLSHLPPRLEGLYALITFLRKRGDALHVAGVLAAGAAGCTTSTPTMQWMGDALPELYGIRDEVGVVAFNLFAGAVQRRVSYPNLMWCAENRAAKFNTRVKENYKFVALPGDDMPARKLFPSLVDVLLPSFVVQDVTEHPVDAAWASALATFTSTELSTNALTWLLTLFGNAVHVPGGLTWTSTPMVVTEIDGVTKWVSSGYLFALALHATVHTDEDVVCMETLQHLETKWRALPTNADAERAGVTPSAALALLLKDANHPLAWTCTASAEISVGRLLAIRAGHFYRFVLRRSGKCVPFLLASATFPADADANDV